MKNIYFFLLLLVLVGCQSYQLKQVKSNPIECPSIIFAKDHKYYIGTTSDNITIDNITFRAEINNAIFSNGCKTQNQIFKSELSLLFIVQPNEKDDQNFTLPYYIAVLDKDREVLEIQYYKINISLKKVLDDNLTVETEVKTKINIESELINQSSTIVLGFALDKKRDEILN